MNCIVHLTPSTPFLILPYAINQKPKDFLRGFFRQDEGKQPGQFLHFFSLNTSCHWRTGTDYDHQLFLGMTIMLLLGIATALPMHPRRVIRHTPGANWFVSTACHFYFFPSAYQS